MWCSKLILQRTQQAQSSRLASWLALSSSRSLRFVVEETNDRVNVTQQKRHHQQRRHLSNDRRHGWKGDKEENKPKANFDEEYLQPAARGELKEKHSSGIPKLSVRRPKGHQIRGGGGEGEVDDGMEEDDYDDREMRSMEDIVDDDWPDDNAESGSSRIGSTSDLVDTMDRDISRARRLGQIANQSGGGGGGRGGGGSNKALTVQEPGPPKDIFNIWGEIEDLKDPEYWKEEDFDVLLDMDRAYFRQTYGEGGSLSGLTKEKLDEIRASDFDWNEIPEDFEFTPKEGEESGDPKWSEGWTEGCGRRFTMEDCDDAIDDEGDYDGPIYTDFRISAGHPESKREPMPYYPKNRINPHPLLLEFYSRWLYVTNLPPALTKDGMTFGDKTCKLTVPQEQEIQITVQRLFGVSADQVYPANETSAFIGFEVRGKRDRVARRGPSDKVLSRPLTISPYTPSEDDNGDEFFAGAEPETIVKIEDIPPHRFSKYTLPRELFPEGTDLAAAYSVSDENLLFQSPTTCLIRFDSKERAESALSSVGLAERLEELGKYQVRLFQARRNVVHDRMEDPTNEIRRQGYRLVVDGDMPSKNFYISHAGAIMLRNLDRESVTREMISDFFQPFSDIRRDVIGSVEFVTCYNGLPTDRAYIGFERIGEAEAVAKALKGRAKIGNNLVYIRLVKDRKIPGTPERHARPERTEKEILKNLNDWEQYVDPEDIKYLDENGIAKEIIGDALRGIRFHNTSFKALDWAKQDERLEPERETGSDYRELVQLYIETLKESVATPENPGEYFELLHQPDETVDPIPMIESEKQRVKKLLRKRAGKI